MTMVSDIKRIRLKEKVTSAVRIGEFTLSSGKTSNFYVDCRLVTLDPEGSSLIGATILEVVLESGATALGGPVTAACPIISATGVMAFKDNVPLKLCYVRSSPKEHGLKKAVEGPALTKNDRVLVVDDVCTSGGSLVRAVESLREETGCQVVGAFVLVDREEGGRERLMEVGVELSALFTKNEFLEGHE